jgi:electron transport complex protein RnfG
MNPVISIGGKLAVICAVAALLLGIVNAMTAPQIEKIKEERLQAALEAVSGGAEIGDPVSADGNDVVERYYPMTAADGDIQGYICRLTGDGYGGDIVILGGFNPDGSVISAKMMDNQETPGLGKEAERDSYMEMFFGTGGESNVPVRKDMLSFEQADSITGATITFIGIGKALQEGSSFVRNLKGE